MGDLVLWFHHHLSHGQNSLSGDYIVGTWDRHLRATRPYMRSFDHGLSAYHLPCPISRLRCVGFELRVQGCRLW